MGRPLLAQYRTSQIILAVFVTVSNAHLSVVCTATSPEHPKAFSMWFGTYHYAPTVAPGTAFIKQPSGAIRSAGFGDICGLVTPLGNLTTATVLDYAASIKSPECMALTDDFGYHGVYDDSTISCYGRDDNANERTAIGLYDGLPTSCFKDSATAAHLIIATWYFVVVPDATSGSGSYETWTEGTDVNLGPATEMLSGVETEPCSIAADNHWFFDISVIMNGTYECTGAPPSGLTTNVVPESLSRCDGSATKIYAGFLCYAHCEPGYNPIGHLTCDVDEAGNTQWNPEFRCSSATVCTVPSLDAGNIAAVDYAIEGVYEPCGRLTEAGIECEFKCSGHGSEGKIMCNSAAQWVPATGYSEGCLRTLAPPTIAPTNAPPTEAPPTNAPPTNAPPTNAPPTNAPPTNA
ncbi:x 3e-10 Uncharacterized protein, partial [Diplonema papillatum]